ncbi:MAG TPA: DNA (cytosine-5-)-methyltransferase [Cyanobacteria bacterium UBA11149]|nr:DNA (cytosine-5-)-methyltransferase [Cyanobacteria bacterium UBA11367]HBE60576.1 DNA (cytosine-5-)-methyltransferase [Cyanobacteria bacterium UBA11366]HBK64962.1 DNA (cytosine-5-)-methyltransferase [Cyanobacteria bacterium UBA11166]HBR72914.1 DNA (cytosine-5-)-methyltransferase [Cyanobacteria bacterium UBA11159]HBS69025.1 DNA (cytosine-5-)-methyltransferase [Cyanobacteria bacterium UBA11153]HBW89570.1 DNA (cytosine-5-)-methyltransferase [Cyanobacteria bacterium UBA11149]HCA93415.1 DNA (cyt
MKSVELFTGAGGLAIGCAMAGFHHEALVELDKRSCDTIRENQQRGITLIRNWRIHQMDVANFDYSHLTEKIDFLAGGPPCQPFSIGGNHGAYLDKRDMFPEFFRAVRELRPKAFLIENVRGLMRRTFINYFQYIIWQLTYPDILPKPDESWLDHWVRLEGYHHSNTTSELSYRVTFKLLNAADYGVPQKRERVFIVGFRSDFNSNWSFPDATHSEDSLIWDKWITGEYWERHDISSKQRPEIPSKLRTRLERFGAKIIGKITMPWRTVRDTIADFPSPENTNLSSKIINHIYVNGAKSYPGHTGSTLDEPAKTLKAGVHGVPGGENMLALPDGQVRYFTVREAARLQTFPDNYYFPNPWGESMRQIGNAVPVHLAYLIAARIASHLQEIDLPPKIIATL